MKATILIATHNSESFIKNCISSVLYQDYKEWEIVIVDDKSSDNTIKIIKKFCNADSRIRIICSSKKINCGGAYSLATNEAKGDICCVLDSDDALSKSSALGKLIKKYTEHDEVGYIWTQFYVCNGVMKKIRKGWSHLPKTSFLEAGLKKTKDRHSFSHWRTFRTEIRDKTTIFKDGLPAAVDKWMSYALEEVATGGFYNKALYLYRSTFTGLTYRGRKHWKRSMKIFRDKRINKNIVPHKTILI